jgi:hypothetical protein
LFRTYKPTTWPGARLPHVWLDDGTAMQDLIPAEGFTILKTGDSKVDVSKLDAEMAVYGAPVNTIEVTDHAARDVYGFDLILLRPDLHIVWRGNDISNAAEIAAVATGHAPAV